MKTVTAVCLHKEGYKDMLRHADFTQAHGGGKVVSVTSARED